MNFSHIFLGTVSLFAGIVIASGIVALLIGLNIIPRYAGITHTANHILLYENAAMLGALWGNLFTIYPWYLPFSHVGTAVFGLFGGVFLGSWIIALTEVMDIIPIMARRTGIVKGLGAVIIATAAGKILWSLLFYYMRW